MLKRYIYKTKIQVQADDIEEAEKYIKMQLKAKCLHPDLKQEFEVQDE